jgi:hypothetical protein
MRNVAMDMKCLFVEALLQDTINCVETTEVCGCLLCVLLEVSAMYQYPSWWRRFGSVERPPRIMLSLPVAADSRSKAV